MVVCLHSIPLPDARNQSLSCAVAATQHETWATFGFLRGMATPTLSGRALCSPQWIELMMYIIESASPLSSQRPPPHTLAQQVMVEQGSLAVLASPSLLPF